MPAPGDQHGSYANPFEEPKPRVAEWAAKEIATIASKLDKQLGPEYISSRSGPGGSRVHYLTAEKCIGLANEVFGFNGWSSSIQNIQVDFADENPQTQRVSIGLSVIVRVTLRDGTYHEDIGYGSIENARGKAMAFEKAKKEGTTDGMKRALRSFGNVLGNCIYDQDFVRQVTKVKAHPVQKFHEDRLHRHSDFVKKGVEKVEPAPAAPLVAAQPVKAEPSESFDDFLGELDEADFCVPGDGHPDEVVLPSVPNPRGPQTTPVAQPKRNASNAGNPAPNRQVHTPQPGFSRPAQNDSRPQPNAPASRPVTRQATTGNGPLAAGAPGDATEPVAFFSARAVNQLPDSSFSAATNGPLAAPTGQHLFNPKAESPSIRKTPGIDHNSSKPLSRTGQHVPPTASQTSPAPGGPNGSSFTPVRPSFGASGGGSAQGARGNVVNPSMDQARRIGAPGGAGSPLSNRGSYKPPSMKRPLQGDAAAQAAARPPLADLSANGGDAVTVGVGTGVDAKRQKLT